MKIKDRNDKSLLTERQWAKKGYVKNNDDSGEVMWTNPYCQVSLLYLSEQEVHQASKEELKTFWHPERQRQAKRRKTLEEQRRKETERYISSLENSVSCLTQQVSSLMEISAKLVRKIEIQPKKSSEMIVLDLETTGLDCSIDEILQVSIISGTGEILYNSYIKPFVKSWESAERINHISPEMVQNAPDIYEEMPKINAILKNSRKIIGYNHDNFDIPFLKVYGAIFPENAEIIDIMFDFAPIYGEYSEYYGNYKWQTLLTCAEYYGYDWGNDKVHDSLSDCRAVLYCYNEMIRRENNDQKRIG